MGTRRKPISQVYLLLLTYIVGEACRMNDNMLKNASKGWNQKMNSTKVHQALKYANAPEQLNV